MNVHEARLALHEKVHSFMVDLAVDESMSVADIADVEESMAELVEMMLDNLQVEILEVGEGGSLMVSVTVGE